jgi:hypothetical protein
LKREALKEILEILEFNKISWLFRKEKMWYINLNKLKIQFSDFNDCEWFKGEFKIEPDIEDIEENRFGKTVIKTNVKFIITEEDAISNYPQRIFLSHKGVDKPQVRAYKKILDYLGFSTWLDEDSMPAGVELERGLLQGFKESCAAIFFITPSFKDIDFLATEINYAIAEKRMKKEKFSIITLLLSGENGEKGAVPELLKQYVWKEPKNELEALEEILRALPIELGKIDWKDLS